MTSKREELDNNKEMNKLLKDNSSKMEIAKEIQSNKKISEIVGDRLTKDLNKRYINPRTKERTGDSYLSVLLKANGLNEVDFFNMKITIIDYNIDI